MTRPTPPPSTVPPLVPRSKLERAARRAWADWGHYAKWTICSDCGDLVYCRAARPSGPFLCLDCFDQR